jgi:ligand-binding SRPBCC domain-containing protein
MTSEVRSLEVGVSFVDEQVTVPFTCFRHEHVFEPTDGGTVMTDHIRFDAPFGLVGDVVERLLLERYLRDLIETRNRSLVAPS